jgi:hypothetical protein
VNLRVERPREFDPVTDRVLGLLAPVGGDENVVVQSRSTTWTFSPVSTITVGVII